MRTLSLSIVALAVLGVSALAWGSHAGFASPVTFTVDATGEEEVNQVSGGGSAIGVFSFDADSEVLTYDVTVHGLSASLVTASHIHVGAPGVSGPPVITLSKGGETSFSGSATLTDAQVADLEAGNYYYNVHSTEHPGGFARGQLVLPKAAAPAITPPSTGDAGLAAGNGSTLWLPVLAAGFGVAAVAAFAVRKSA